MSGSWGIGDKIEYHKRYQYVAWFVFYNPTGETCYRVFAHDSPFLAAVIIFYQSSRQRVFFQVIF
jgi:hypothetical protein